MHGWLLLSQHTISYAGERASLQGSVLSFAKIYFKDAGQVMKMPKEGTIKTLQAPRAEVVQKSIGKSLESIPK